VYTGEYPPKEFFEGGSMFGLGLPELLIILVIVVLLFGAGRLPQIGSGIGEGIRNFKKSMKEKDEVDVTPAKGDGEKK
jgi:sec-independent protein translocase protein TatA